MQFLYMSSSKSGAAALIGRHTAPAPSQTLNVTTLETLLKEPSSSEYQLEAHNRGITRLVSFGPHVKLRSVDLSFNHLTALDALSALVDLRELKVYGNQITSLDGLERNTNLEKLLAHDNCIAEIPIDVAKLKALKVLRLDRNRLTSVGPLIKSSSLVYLDASGNTLTSLKGLQHLLQLEDLLLDHNELRDVAGLGDCKKLLGLHASDNHITTLAGLKGLQALEVLHLRRNHLSSLSSLPVLFRLSELYLRGNRLTSIESLPDSAPVLEILDIRDNRMEDAEAMCGALGRMKELKEAWVGHNPCTPIGHTGCGKWWHMCVRAAVTLERLEDVKVLTAHRATLTDEKGDSIPAALDPIRPPTPSLPLLPPARPSTASRSKLGREAEDEAKFSKPTFRAPSARTGVTEKFGPLASLEARAERLRESMTQLRASLRQSIPESTPRAADESPETPRPASTPLRPAPATSENPAAARPCTPTTTTPQRPHSCAASGGGGGSSEAEGAGAGPAKANVLHRALRFAKLADETPLRRRLTVAGDESTATKDAEDDEGTDEPKGVAPHFLAMAQEDDDLDDKSASEGGEDGSEMDIEEEHAKLLSRLEKEYEDMVRRASADDDKGAESDQGSEEERTLADVKDLALEDSSGDEDDDDSQAQGKPVCGGAPHADAKAARRQQGSKAEGDGLQNFLKIEHDPATDDDDRGEARRQEAKAALSKLPLFEDDIPWMEDSQTVEVVVLKGSKDGTRGALVPTSSSPSPRPPPLHSSGRSCRSTASLGSSRAKGSATGASPAPPAALPTHFRIPSKARKFIEDQEARQPANAAMAKADKHTLPPKAGNQAAAQDESKTQGDGTEVACLFT